MRVTQGDIDGMVGARMAQLKREILAAGLPDSAAEGGASRFTVMCVALYLGENASELSDIIETFANQEFAKRFQTATMVNEIIARGRADALSEVVNLIKTRHAYICQQRPLATNSEIAANFTMGLITEQFALDVGKELKLRFA